MSTLSKKTMPSVDFYVLNTADREEIYRFLCRLVDKAYQQQHHAYIHSRSLEEAQRLDDLLWTFRDISFIPHQVSETSEGQLPVAVTIATHKPQLFNHDILFNLTHEVPHFCLEFTRVIEIVSDEKKDKIQARRKYKVYQNNHYPLATHNISLVC